MISKEGVTCSCGEFTQFGVWVLAHWDTEITFVCPTCKKRYYVCAGEYCEE